MDEYLNNKEVEKIFKVTKHTIMNWRKSGKLPYIKINSRKFLYKKEDIEKMIDKNLMSGS